MLYTLADPGADPRLLELVSGPISADDEVREAVALLRESPGLARARETLASYAAAARSELEAFPASSSLAALDGLTYFVVERTR